MLSDSWERPQYIDNCCSVLGKNSNPWIISVGVFALTLRRFSRHIILQYSLNSACSMTSIKLCFASKQRDHVLLFPAQTYSLNNLPSITLSKKHAYLITLKKCCLIFSNFCGAEMTLASSLVKSVVILNSFIHSFG